ncbi:Lipid-A-disaccharide synthase [hydrothermal vent metagenome]|uniref:lipid-A-disaccharide synthase n=1 Tax=hydrothermal vent metagenome TaxID=652676 RepID=A0A3B1AUJ4_9ZZZZ
MLRVGIVANEMSGDLLGAGLMQALRKQVPDIAFEGVGGPRMLEQGCQSLFPMERLSVMGLVEVLKHLPELLSIRRQLTTHFLTNPPDVFIGIDAPDFNLGLETRLKQAGILTVHYVSPTVWAWRPGRVHKIRDAVDLLLSLFPFEAEFLEKHQVPVSYVGHALADEISLDNNQAEARNRLGLNQDDSIIAVLPGSRMSEIQSLSESYLGAVCWCHERRPGLRFVVPLVSLAVRQAFEKQVQTYAPDLPILLLDGNARDAIVAADVVLTASGTATLETLLLNRPMVVGYRVQWLTYWIVKGLNLIKIPHIAMANLLAGDELAPEFIQGECTPDNLGGALMRFLDSPEQVAEIKGVYHRIHRDMRQDSSRKAAEAILAVIDNNKACL